MCDTAYKTPSIIVQIHAGNMYTRDNLHQSKPLLICAHLISSHSDIQDLIKGVFCALECEIFI